MQYDIDPVTILEAAISLYGPEVRVGAVMWIDTTDEYILVNVTPAWCKSFRGRFYYRKGSFDAHMMDKA